MIDGKTILYILNNSDIVCICKLIKLTISVIQHNIPVKFFTYLAEKFFIFGSEVLIKFSPCVWFHFRMLSSLVFVQTLSQAWAGWTETVKPFCGIIYEIIYKWKKAVIILIDNGVKLKPTAMPYRMNKHIIM